MKFMLLILNKNHPKHPHPVVLGFGGASHLRTLNFPSNNGDFCIKTSLG